MFIKIFEGSTESCTEQANKWLKVSTGLRVLQIRLVPRHDLFQATGEVCNQWSALILVCEKETVNVHQDISR